MRSGASSSAATDQVAMSMLPSGTTTTAGPVGLTDTQVTGSDSDASMGTAADDNTDRGRNRDEYLRSVSGTKSGPALSGVILSAGTRGVIFASRAGSGWIKGASKDRDMPGTWSQLGGAAVASITSLADIKTPENAVTRRYITRSTVKKPAAKKDRRDTKKTPAEDPADIPATQVDDED